MSNFSGMMKGGWHPKGRDGGKESWRGDFKGINQVAGWMGKGRQPGGGDMGGSDHMSRPLATLKDPASFGPPPKNVNYHGGAALPNEITPHTSGLGAPLTQREVQSARAVNSPTSVEEPEETRPAAPPLPYRADRTGLKTDHLPPPPVHRDGQTTAPSVAQTSTLSPAPKPGLPPRLPMRQNSSYTSASEAAASSPLPTYESAVAPPQHSSGYLNQHAANQLEKAGVKVPDLGIGSSNPWKTEQSQRVTTTSPPPAAPQGQLSELQARFARMTSSPRPPQDQAQSEALASSPVPTQGTSALASPTPNGSSTWGEKQAALQTASNLHRDPSSVSVADAQAAAKTANDFRAKHQEHISTGAKKANEWNKKYNVTGRLNSFLEKQTTGSPTSEQPQSAAVQQPLASSSDISASIARKPPPPPPPKKPAAMHAPPPVPLGTRPSFT